MINVTVWNEFYHEKNHEQARETYPYGIHECIKSFLQSDEFQVRTATLDDEECGLTQEVLDDTDVLIWWAHMKHDDVPDKIVKRVQDSVLKGMGVIFLHSAHLSKPFKALMGTTCNLSWREDGDLERVWVINPAHPIAKGLGRYIELPHEETYGEPFGIPEPDELVFIGSFEGSEVFRSGCCWKRGNGKIFYFQPGHETNPTFKIREVQQVIKNAVEWCKPELRSAELDCPHIQKIQ